MKRIGGVLVPSLLVTLVMSVAAQKRAITIDDYLALKSVGNPQLSPDGKWVAYTVTEQSLKDNRGIARIWLADVASGAVRQLTAGPRLERQPRPGAARRLRPPRAPARQRRLPPAAA